MENGIELTAVFIANGMALLLAGQLLYSNHWRYAGQKIKDNETKILRALIYISALACIIDPVICYADGKPGPAIWGLVYTLNTLLFFIDIVVGVGWILLVSYHLLGSIPKEQNCFIGILTLLGILAVLANLFVPVLYSVDESNVYHREVLFWLITVIEAVFLLDGIFIYVYVKMQGGIFKFFPVWQFVVPIVIGIVVQGRFYGVSIVYPAAMISFAGLVSSLKDEALFIDPLTGLYNRSFLNVLEEEIARKGTSVSVTGLMLDLNGFKRINDICGHAEGDAALKTTADILKSTIGALGCVVRYAGDEFVVLLNTSQRGIVESCIRSITSGLEEENNTSEKNYKLMVSVGYCTVDKNHPTLESALHEADQAMYDEKRKYHCMTREITQDGIIEGKMLSAEKKEVNIHEADDFRIQA